MVQFDKKEPFPLLKLNAWSPNSTLIMYACIVCVFQIPCEEVNSWGKISILPTIYIRNMDVLEPQKS